MATKPDLNKLRVEIDNRKRERNTVSSPSGDGQDYSGVSPRDKFLYELTESLKSGRDNASSNLVKTVNNKAVDKNGGGVKIPLNETPAPTHQPERINLGIPMDISPERDELLYRDLENKRKQTLSESMQGYISMPNTGRPMVNQPPTNSSMQLNEAYLTENVKNIVNGYLTENLEPIFEEAIKSTIIEMYAVERIKEVLTENSEMIRTIVYETIREIQKKNKAKAQS